MYEDRNAIYALNRYVSKLLKENLGWDSVTYTGPQGTVTSSRIVPASQQPEFMATGKPFIVYGSSVGVARHLYANRRESLAYTIYSPSVTEVNKVVNLLVETFERQDEAVEDVNLWLDFEAKQTGRTSRNLAFTSLQPQMGEKAEPADEEGGYASALFLMDTTYVVNNPTIVTRFNTYP